MNACDRTRELLAPLAYGELGPESAAQVREHLADCDDCAALVDTLRSVADATAVMHDLEPPQHLADELAGSPCRQWLGLLFRAMDHELTESGLERLLGHLESCPTCRRTWSDLALTRQAGEAMEPPADLLSRCIAIRSARSRRPALGKRTAIAAAYVLAVITSLIVGDPVAIARQHAGEAVSKVATTITTEVNEVADDGRGEARVMVYRAWQWSVRQADAVRDAISTAIDAITPGSDTGSGSGSDSGPDSHQGETP